MKKVLFGFSLVAIASLVMAFTGNERINERQLSVECWCQNGKCPGCNGAGKVSKEKKRIICPSCNGTGAHKECGGDGKIVD